MLVTGPTWVFSLNCSMRFQNTDPLCGGGSSCLRPTYSAGISVDVSHKVLTFGTMEKPE